MDRHHYLVTYDVSDDKRRNEVFKTLKDQGDHAQYSVFICALTQSELAALRGRLTSAIHHREDQVLILDLGSVDRSLDLSLECIGKSYCPTTRVLVV